ncbi:MAG: hypothetical protein LUG52_03325, partial [Clostridia bacterium]|nr:hypothetical protein [Clostridia bacterium]
MKLQNKNRAEARFLLDALRRGAGVDGGLRVKSKEVISEPEWLFFLRGNKIIRMLTTNSVVRSYANEQFS